MMGEPAVEPLVVVGGGFRATTLLASSRRLRQLGPLVFERSDSLGPGGFRHYAITSTSIGSRFLDHVDLSGDLAHVAADPRFAAVHDATAPRDLRQVASALGCLGEAVRDSLGEDRVQLGAQVREVRVSVRGERASVVLQDGTQIVARHVLLATGRCETPADPLEPWAAKTMLSSAVIDPRHRNDLVGRLRAADPAQPVVIAGASHSAMSVLSTVLRLLRDYRLCPDRSIAILQRSPARLMYSDSVAAARAQIPGRELLFDPGRDVCPETGIVFRDSGLRHMARDLFCAVWSGRLPEVRLVPIDDLQDATDLLDRAAVIVQALGYHGQAPNLFVDGHLVRPDNSTSRVATSSDGAAVIDGTALDDLSAIRLDPTPSDQRDNTAYGSGLYRRLEHRLLNLLEPVGMAQ